MEANDLAKIINKGIKIRALCFFTFSSYVVNINVKKDDSENLIKNLLEVRIQ